MALVCDTGAVFGLYDADDAHHAAIKALDRTLVIEQSPGRAASPDERPPCVPPRFTTHSL
jgi:hypothetical protein